MYGYEQVVILLLGEICNGCIEHRGLKKRHEVQMDPKGLARAFPNGRIYKNLNDRGQRKLPQEHDWITLCHSCKANVVSDVWRRIFVEGLDCLTQIVYLNMECLH